MESYLLIACLGGNVVLDEADSGIHDLLFKKILQEFVDVLILSHFFRFWFFKIYRSLSTRGKNFIYGFVFAKLFGGKTIL